MKNLFSVFIFYLCILFGFQEVNAFVWENTDERRKEWQQVIKDSFLSECRANPTTECLKTSSVMQLTKDVCGKVPPGVRAEDHLDIFRGVCLNDVELAIETTITEIRNEITDAQQAAFEQRIHDRQQSETQERDRNNIDPVKELSSIKGGVQTAPAAAPPSLGPLITAANVGGVDIDRSESVGVTATFFSALKYLLFFASVFAAVIVGANKGDLLGGIDRNYKLRTFLNRNRKSIELGWIPGFAVGALLVLFSAYQTGGVIVTVLAIVLCGFCIANKAEFFSKIAGGLLHPRYENLSDDVLISRFSSESRIPGSFEVVIVSGNISIQFDWEGEHWVLDRESFNQAMQNYQMELSNWKMLKSARENTYIRQGRNGSDAWSQANADFAFSSPSEPSQSSYMIFESTQTGGHSVEISAKPWIPKMKVNQQAFKYSESHRSSIVLVYESQGGRFARLFNYSVLEEDSQACLEEKKSLIDESALRSLEQAKPELQNFKILNLRFTGNFLAYRVLVREDTASGVIYDGLFPDVIIKS